MEQVERCELDAIDGPSLDRLQLQTMLKRASAETLGIGAGNIALMATEAAAMQSQNAMAGDCSDRLAALQADLDDVFNDRPSECNLRAADGIWGLIERAEMELKQIDSDASEVLSMTAERCDALAARAIQLQAQTAELLCRMGELNTHVTTRQAIMSGVNARSVASPRPGQSLPATSRDRVFIAISLCGHRRTNTARRRGVLLASTAPASAKTNRTVRVGMPYQASRKEPRY